MPKSNTKVVPIAELGLSPAEFARLMQGDVRILRPEFRLKLAESLKEEKSRRTPPSLPLRQLEEKFFDWLDASTARAPRQKIKAVAICLYEGIDFFEAGFFGCPAYSATTPDWACTWCHEGKGRFVFASDEIEPDWEIGLKTAKKMYRKYLASDRAGARAIREIGVAAIGFSDGDLNVVLAPKSKGKNR